MQTANSDYLYVPNIPQEIGSNYIIKKELGKGAYGTVYLAVSRVRSMTVFYALTE